MGARIGCRRARDLWRQSLRIWLKKSFRRAKLANQLIYPLYGQVAHDDGMPVSSVLAAFN